MENEDTNSAADVIHGFHYQLMLSSLAWIKLPVGAHLLLEVSEDFAVDEAGSRNAEQVKATRASKPKKYSLQSEPIRDALNRFWARQQLTSNLRHSLNFTARGGASRERDHKFPDDSAGLDYWASVAIEGDTQPVRSALAKIFKDEPLGIWIASNPSDAELRERLLQRVRWNLRAADTQEVDAQLLEAVKEFCVARRLPVALAAACKRAIRDKITETAQQPRAEDRILTATQLSELIENEIERGMRMLGQSEQLPQQAPAGFAVVQTLPPTATWLCRRSATVERIVESTSGAPLIWLHGTNGAGKSTLAQLVARRLGGNWGHLDLRALQSDPKASLAAWRELQAFCVGAERPDGIVIDDLSQAALQELVPRLSVFLPTFVSNVPRVIVTSASELAPARMLDLGLTARSIIQVPYLNQEEVAELLREPLGPAVDTIHQWSAMILVATGGGHPLLVSAKIASLRSRNWPKNALVEDLIGTSESVQATREEARGRLLRELTSLGQPQGADAAQLLRRMASVFDRVDLSLARKLGGAEPVVGTAGDTIPLLRGTWIESLAEGQLRVSPLVSDIANDVPADEQARYKRVAAEHWLSGGTLDHRTLPLCFWNAFLGKHDEILALLATKISSQTINVLQGAMAPLTPLLAFGTDGPIYPTNPRISPSLRLLQFDVANSIDDRGQGDRIAGALLQEIDATPVPELRAMLSSVASTKVLMARDMRLSAPRVIDYALRLDAVTEQVREIAGSSLVTLRQDLLADFGDVTLGQFLYASRITQVRSSEEFLETIEALNARDPATRDMLLNPLVNNLPDGMSLFVAGGWANDQLADRDMAEAGRLYDRAEAIASGWNRDDVNIEIACARSVITEECLGDVDGALAFLDVATARYGQHVNLLRQRSKVLNHAGRHEEALGQLLAIEDTVGERSSFDRALALRDGAVSASRISSHDTAVRLFGKARTSALETNTNPALTTGLLVDGSMAKWNSGDRLNGLADLALAFDELAALDPSASRQSQRVHQYARAAAGLFFRDVEDQSSPRPDIAAGGASSLGVRDEPLLEIELKHLADHWRILALVETALGADLGIARRLKGQPESAVSMQIASLTNFIEYRSALSSGNIEATIGSGHKLALLMFMISKNGRLPADPRDAAKHSTTSASELFADRSASEGLRMMVVDIMLLRHLRGDDVSQQFLEQLREATRAAYGYQPQIEALLAAAASPLSGGDHSNQAFLAQMFKLTQSEILSDPSARWHRDVLALTHTSHSFGRGVLEPLLIARIHNGWAGVIREQRFMLTNPLANAHRIEEALSRSAEAGLQASAKVLLAATPAVVSDAPEEWIAMLDKIANGDIPGGPASPPG